MSTLVQAFSRQLKNEDTKGRKKAIEKSVNYSIMVLLYTGGPIQNRREQHAGQQQAKAVQQM